MPPLRRGAHGSVYSARWKNSKTPVAVKVLQLFGVTSKEIAKSARAISTELAVLNAVRHPSVIYVYGVMVTQDASTPGCAAVRIVMELAECSLQQLLTEAQTSSSSDGSSGSKGVASVGSDSSPLVSPPIGSARRTLSMDTASSPSTSSSSGRGKNISLNMRTRLSIAESVAAGLSHLHSARHPVVHRDLKPANILIRRQGDDVSACIADFGIALLDKTDMTLVSPKSYQPAGTLQYMAPEILNPSGHARRAGGGGGATAGAGLERLDLKAADVYSMGALLRALLARDDALDRSRMSWFDVSAATELEIPSVESMLEAMTEGTPRRCAEVVRACLLPAAERPSPELVAAGTSDHVHFMKPGTQLLYLSPPMSNHVYTSF